MISNGHVIGDGSWNLKILVTDLQAERLIRVKGDVHIGGVMLKLVDDLEIFTDWSDHALWWPEKNAWLSRTRTTLDQYGVHADALLHFTPMHKVLKLQLPDLRLLDLRVNFSIKTFSAVVQLCKDLGIRHPEELSLCKPLEPNHLKYNYKDMPKRKEANGVHKNGTGLVDTNTFIANDPIGSQGSLDKSNFMCAPVTPNRQPPNSSTPFSSPSPVNNTLRRNGDSWNTSYNSNSLEYLNGNGLDSSLAHTKYPSSEARKQMLKPKSLVEKARMNVAWLDSSLSIMEQGVREYDVLCLRFKFYAFYDLNPKYDAVRINQIYEQAKWQLLTEEVDCTEEEMLLFAALQFQVKLQADLPVNDTIDNDNSPIPPTPEEDDIDAALSNLQSTLEGSTLHSPHSPNSGHSHDITQVPELKDQLRFLKPKRFTLKAYKKYWFTCKDLTLFMYKSREEMVHNGVAVMKVGLRGCEVSQEVNLAQGKFVIKLEVATAEGMSEMLIRCDDESQFARWMACCKLASKGRSLADSSYEAEKKTILDFLNLQKRTEGPAINPESIDIPLEEYLSSKYLKKPKAKLQHRILEAHNNVKDLGLLEAKLNYIKAWQLLPEHGISLFVVKFVDSKKEELLGVAYNRIMKMDINSGDHQKTWRFNTMKAWNVNWESKNMMVQFEEGNIIFSCSSADCKVIHEFIGGYIFLSTRSKDASQTLNEELFHKLTGGWS